MRFSLQTRAIFDGQHRCMAMHAILQGVDAKRMSFSHKVIYYVNFISDFFDSVQIRILECLHEWHLCNNLVNIACTK
jgi:hypothetical protein